MKKGDWVRVIKFSPLDSMDMAVGCIGEIVKSHVDYSDELTPEEDKPLPTAHDVRWHYLTHDVHQGDRFMLGEESLELEEALEVIPNWVGKLINYGYEDEGRG